MKEQQKLVEQLLESMRARTSSPLPPPSAPSTPSTPTPGQEHWTILKSEFDGLVTSVMGCLGQLEEQLAAIGRQLSYEQLQGQELVAKGQELQRLKHLLLIKEQLLKNEQTDNRQLTARVREIEQLVQASHKMENTSRLDQLAETPSAQSGLQLQPGADHRQRAVSIQGRTAPENSHQGDLEMARLRNQLGKAENHSRTLGVQLALLTIENQHLEAECQLACSRERELSRQLEESLGGQGRRTELERQDEESSMVGLFAGGQAASSSREGPSGGGEGPSGSREGPSGGLAKQGARFYLPHPPTPHFSSVGCGFGKRLAFCSTSTARASVCELGAEEGIWCPPVM